MTIFRGMASGDRGSGSFVYCHVFQYKSYFLDESQLDRATAASSFFFLRCVIAVSPDYSLCFLFIITDFRLN